MLSVGLWDRNQKEKNHVAGNEFFEFLRVFEPTLPYLPTTYLKVHTSFKKIKITISSNTVAGLVVRLLPL